MKDSDTMTKIAFLGTGLMGAPMVRNLLAAGHDVSVWNRTAAKAQPLATDGASVAETPTEAVNDAQFIITMLSDGAAVAELVWNQDVADAMAPGAILIDMSSARKADAEAMAIALKSRGHDALDAPVSGGTKGAENASLAIMVGGEQAAYDEATDVLACLGRPVHVGPPGAGQLAKLINQTIVATALGAVSEAMAMAEAGGADPAAVRAALAGGFA
ncbi:MAG: NAD(P)-dependent oxidoreductase, partial [Pseudomonadota bacterium]